LRHNTESRIIRRSSLAPASCRRRSG
jgi:hypothetical protein